MLYSNDEIRNIVNREYDYNVGDGVINRYIDNYLPRIEYHSVLLNGNDRIELEFKHSEKNLFEYLDEYIPPQILRKCIISIKNNKVYINNRKPIKEIIRLYKEEGLLKTEKDFTCLNLATTFKVIISARPEDFINASSNTTGWRSCFSKDGEYHCSTNSFYTDKRFLISYIETDKGLKIGRRWIHIDYDLNYVSSGKEYGTYSYYNIKKVREHIQSLINPNVQWYSYTSEETHTNASAIYCDNNYTISFIDNKDAYYNIYSELEDGLNSNDRVGSGFWESCTCDECGVECDEDDRYYIEENDTYVCESCIGDYTYCDYHSRFERTNEHEFYNYGRFDSTACEEGALEYGAVVETREGDYILNSEAKWLEDIEDYVHIDDDYLYIEDEDIYVSTNYDHWYNEEDDCNYSINYYNNNIKGKEDEERN